MQNLPKANKRLLLGEVFNEKHLLNNKKIVTL